jgi:glycosyltransferase involved in cell wall biosynthesis
MPTITFIVPYGFNDRLWNFPEFVLARALARCGWRVAAIVFWEGESRRREQINGVFIVRVQGKVSAMKYLLRLIVGSDLVHIFHLRNPLGLPAFILARLLGKPVIFSEAGLLHDPYLVQDRDNPLAYPLKLDGMRSSLKSRLFHLPILHADKIVFLSKHSYELAPCFGLDLDRITWLPHIVDGSMPESSWGSTTSSFEGFDLNMPFGLFVGQLKLRKGWDVLLHAIPLVPRDLLERFVFVTPSQGYAVDQFCALVKRLGIEDRVILIRGLNRANLVKLYTSCQLVIVPSHYEGFGLATLEAFEHGKPVVASDVVELNNYLLHGQNAFLVPPNDPISLASGIIEVIVNEDLKQWLIKNGKETFKMYHIENWLPKWIEIYDEVLQSRVDKSIGIPRKQ